MRYDYWPMANQEHLKILAKGVDEWNKWRTTHPVLAPDLSDAILSQLTNIEHSPRSRVGSSPAASFTIDDYSSK